MYLLRYIFFLVLVAVVVAKALPPAGITISNTAKIEYEDESGFKYKDFSNTVFVKIKQVYGISIEPDFQSITSFPNSEINVSYILKNTGNGKDRYTLQVKNETNDDGEIENLKIYVDENENGIVDPGEQEYNNTNPPYIDSQGYISLVVTGKIPLDPSTGTYKISLEGYSLGDNQAIDTQNITEIKVSPSFSVVVKKESDKQEVNPGDNITFSINIQNHGTQTVKSAQIQTDFDNDGNPEEKTGILLEDKLPKYTIYKTGKIYLVEGQILFKGTSDQYWKNSLDTINGKLEYIGFLVDPLLPDQQAKFEINLVVDNDALAETIQNKASLLTGDGVIDSNAVLITIKEKLSIVVDDTDDNGAFTGSNRADDNDDSMIIYSMTSGKGMYVDFKNEAWNLGNTPQVINIIWDKGSSENINESVMKVIFLDKDGNPLVDTNDDGYTDLGIVKPGERVEFITRIYVQGLNFKDVVIAVKGFTQNKENSDITFNIIKDIQPNTAVVNVTVAAPTGIGQEKLKRQRVIIYEFDQNGNRTDTPPIILWTDDNGYILYDEEGNVKTLYNVLQPGKKYRLTIYGEYKGRSYTISPFIEKKYFEEVNNTGEEKCWNRIGQEVQCSNRKDIVKIKVLEDGTKQLYLPLDPAGYVYDAATGDKINNACVYFYRCNNKNCDKSILVDEALLDMHSNPDTGWQTNPQLTSEEYNAAKGKGTFEFIFRNFTPELEGWYYLEVDFECPGANTELKNIYEPVRLQKNKVWNPYTDMNKPYQGELFYIDNDFPEPLMIIPLGKPIRQNLEVRKSVSPSVASIGDIVEWSISVKNKGDSIAYDVTVNDYLPRGFRYRKSSTRINGVSSKDPSISKDGRILSWNVGNLNPGEVKTVKFYTSVIASAQEGKHKNVADAQGWAETTHVTKITSNQGFTYIKLTKGIFTDKGYIFGKVFIDQNGNRIHDENEPVIQGAKIYLDNGRYAVTDVEGKYHFDNLNPRTYVVKIDKTSLPKGAKLVVLNNRNAGDPDTVFADLYPGEMHKVNFALAPFNPNLEVFKTAKKIKGKLQLERGIEDILVEPLKENIKVKHYILINNKSKQPLYEFSYTETSNSLPQKGTVYLNSAPFKDPSVKGKTFTWNIPLILPGETVKITWLSVLPKGVIEPKAEVSLKLNPNEKDVSLPIKVPVEFGIIKDKEYQLVVYFDFGSAQLSEEAKRSLEKLVSYLRKTDYKVIYIKIKGHTDAVRVIDPEIKSNTNLSLLRAEAVKKFLKEHLIDLKRVEIKWGD